MFSVGTSYDQDDISFITHYKNGIAKSCSVGFEKNTGNASVGNVVLPLVDFDISASERNTFLTSYPNAYVIDLKDKDTNKVYRNYFGSSSIFSVQINPLVRNSTNLLEIGTNPSWIGIYGIYWFENYLFGTIETRFRTTPWTWFSRRDFAEADAEIVNIQALTNSKEILGCQ